MLAGLLSSGERTAAERRKIEIDTTRGVFRTPPNRGLYRRFRTTGDLPYLCGTVYYDGAGMRSAYIPDMVAALAAAGIANAYAANPAVSHGVLGDVRRVIGLGRAKFREPFDPGLVDDGILNLDDFAYVDGLAKAGGDNAALAQFNLIGYSHGSLLAARFAWAYAAFGGRIDHLVLLASPIGSDFLALLKSHGNIRHVLVRSLGEFGDPVHPGISGMEMYAAVPRLLYQVIGRPTLRNVRKWGRLDPEGHFRFLAMSPDGSRRRRKFAKELVRAGLR